MEPAQQVLTGITVYACYLLTHLTNSADTHTSAYGMVLCSHSQTPVDELLGKPYQDVMLTIIESYQHTKTNEDTDPPDDSNSDEFDEADNKEPT